jgi:hypothetical protein
VADETGDQADAGSHGEYCEHREAADREEGDATECRPAAGDGRARHAGLGVVAPIADESERERRDEHADEPEHVADERQRDDPAERHADRRERERHEKGPWREHTAHALAEPGSTLVGPARRAPLAGVAVGRR